MKKRILSIIVIVAAVIGIWLGPAQTIQAAEIIATMEGTIDSRSTAKLLYLDTKDGMMEIKIDAGTDTGDCKILLPGQKIAVSIYNGGDEYLHAAKIAMGDSSGLVTIDKSNPSTVTGKINKKTTTKVLYLDVSGGTMEIKLDTTTDYSGLQGISMLGDTINVTVARGSDAYMHALSIYNSGNAAAAAQSAPKLETVYAKNGAETTPIYGTVTKNPTSNMICFQTQYGEMEIKIDSDTQVASAPLLLVNNKLLIYVYRGDDAYMHAAKVVSNN